jgi:hypothetical protein
MSIVPVESRFLLHCVSCRVLGGVCNFVSVAILRLDGADAVWRKYLRW